MDNDDRMIGQWISRREALRGMGVAGAALWLRIPRDNSRPPAVSIPDCIARPEQTEGPYFVEEQLNRSDIRSDPATGTLSPGTPLQLTFRVARLTAGACAPAAGILVDVWHCDANGTYSDEQDMTAGFDTRGKKFLRGYQVTDKNGIVRFQTIYPGWYDGRAVHIHFKLRTAPDAKSGHEFTSQLYFPDPLNAKVHAALPYSRKGAGRMPNGDDGIFQDGGKELLLDAAPQASGYAATFEVGLQF